MQLGWHCTAPNRRIRALDSTLFRGRFSPGYGLAATGNDLNRPFQRKTDFSPSFPVSRGRRFSAVGSAAILSPLRPRLVGRFA